MSATYVPEVGDRVYTSEWGGPGKGNKMEVTAVGARSFLGLQVNGIERQLDLSFKWVKVDTPQPLPDRWVNATPAGLGLDHPTRAAADAAAGPTRIALLHIWTTPDHRDVFEIERVTT